MTRKTIKRLLSKCEHVSFKGTYDVATRNSENDGRTSTTPAYVSKNKKGFNLRIVRSDYVTEKGKTDKYLNETYTLTSYDEDRKCKKGEIVWEGTYPDIGSSGISSSSVQRFNVLGGSGIYKDVCAVIIDFSNPIRKIYFIKHE